MVSSFDSLRPHGAQCPPCGRVTPYRDDKSPLLGANGEPQAGPLPPWTRQKPNSWVYTAALVGL